MFRRRPADSVVHGSTPRRLTPARLHIFAVLHNAGNGRIATGIGKHLGAPRPIILRVIICKLEIVRVVVIASLLAIGTARLGVDNQIQLNRHPRMRLVYQCHAQDAKRGLPVYACSRRAQPTYRDRGRAGSPSGQPRWGADPARLKRQAHSCRGLPEQHGLNTPLLEGGRNAPRSQ